ncbi:FtsX-like permease family protein [Stieleria sp. TO1_6]|uniref:ABC transporter permease n=1 Tax=Stieleria tagensis TaxID=2956795 RepID=UPI00209AE828|nr:FtsX-like permease family protein [Stieleria tagensis]MCO8122110.1 FtsX-like permease family protein [Stieleria tagensis]
MSASPSPTSPGLTVGRMVAAGVRYNWRTSLAVALGVAIATSVIVGALLVGDSMRGSLRGLTIERLGKIDSVVAPGGFFASDRASETLGVDANDLATIVLFDHAVIETRSESGVRRSGAVQTIGCDEAFWKMDVSGIAPSAMPDQQSIVLTESLATELGVQIGDLVTVRLPAEQAVPADSPLGRKDLQTEGIPRLKVLDILPDRGLARFSLAPTQSAPKNVFLSRELVASVLDREGQSNVALSSVPIDPQRLQIELDDLGIKLQRETQQFDGETIFDYYSVTSDRLLLDETAVAAITAALPAGSVTAAMTYLANAIEQVDDQGNVIATVPYSTITAMDSSPQLPLNFDRDDAADDGATDVVPIVLNSWAADRLQATAGTRLTIAYYEPEVKNGKEVERTFSAVVTDVVPITEPAKRYFRRRPAEFDKPPTRYNDPHLTPSVPGVTDQDSMSDWDLPFELTREIPRADDDYWKNHRLTPKAFIPLAEGQRLFGSRFGKTTGLRIDPDVVADEQQLQQTLITATKPLLPELGWSVRSIRQSQLTASQGTTPFDGLFLALSCFVIFSAVMLIAMLFRLGLTARSQELGTMMAMGLQRRQVSRMFLGEGLIIAAIGMILGVIGGIAYAVLVLAALRTFWIGAVTVPFLTFHASPLSLIGGAVAGMLIGIGTLAWTMRSMLKNQVVDLLGRRSNDDRQSIATATTDDGDAGAAASQRIGWLANWPGRIGLGLFGLAIAAGVGGALSGGQTAAGGFVGGGMLLLVAILMVVYETLRQSRQASDQLGSYSLGKLARSNSTRAPLRSTLTIGLMATASFLIVAITAFRLQPTDEGTGGFDLIAQAAQPLYEDLSDPGVQSGLLGVDAKRFSAATVVSLRVRSGQDASCNNLYQATEPTVLGVPARAAAELGRFRFYAAGDPPAADQNAWALLDRKASGAADDPIPMIVDQNTAMWSLKMIQGVGERKAFVYDNQTLHFEVVGLLENSLLQGRLMIGESNFEKAFPAISGYQLVLIDAPGDDVDSIAQSLETRLSDVGLDVADAGDVLSGMMAVQNTYLRTFQSLGGLGLLLGTVGLAVAQLRNVLERRSELAVMRAIGFTKQRLAAMVMGETATLLLMGVGCGVVCAVIAVLPHALSSGIRPPIIEPILLVLGIVVFGLLAGLIAAGKVVRMHLLDSLRGS